MRVLIIGPQASGKGLLMDVLDHSPDLSQTGGDFGFQSCKPNTTELRTADRYVLARRKRCVEAIQRHNYRTMKLATAQQIVDDAWRRIDAHVAGSPTIDVDYRDVVANVASVIDRLAHWLDIPSWPYDEATIFDGDAIYG